MRDLNFLYNYDIKKKKNYIEKCFHEIKCLYQDFGHIADSVPSSLVLAYRHLIFVDLLNYAPCPWVTLLHFIMSIPSSVSQISQKKLKKYEKEYHTIREQQEQQEAPIDRYEVDLFWVCLIV